MEGLKGGYKEGQKLREDRFAVQRLKGQTDLESGSRKKG